MQRQVEFSSGQTVRAIALMCSAILLFSLLDTTAKYLSTKTSIAILQIIWIRFAGHVVLNLIWLGPSNVPTLAASKKPAMQMLRGLFMLGATFFNFLAVSHLRLDQTVTIFFLTPLVVAVLAGPLLNEWVGWRRLLAILVGFSGVLLVTRPGFGGVHWAISYSFGAMACYALYNLATRYLAAHDSSRTTQFYTPLTGFLIVAPGALMNWSWPPEPLVWLLLLSLGLVGGFGHWLLILAHRIAPAPTLAPFTYTGMIYMPLLGYLVFADVPDRWTIAGGAIVISSGLYLLYRERHAVSEGTL